MFMCTNSSLLFYIVLNFFLYDDVPPVIHNFHYKASVEHGNEYHTGSCVSRGEQHRIRTLYSLTKKCPGGHNNLDLGGLLIFVMQIRYRYLKL